MRRDRDAFLDPVISKQHFGPIRFRLSDYPVSGFASLATAPEGCIWFACQNDEPYVLHEDSREG